MPLGTIRSLDAPVHSRRSPSNFDPRAIPTNVPREVLSAAHILATWWPRRAWLCGRPDDDGNSPEALPMGLHDALSPLGFQAWDAGEERLVFLHRQGWWLKVQRDYPRADRKEMKILARLEQKELQHFA